MYFDKTKFPLRLKEILDTTDWSCRRLGEKVNLTGATINRYSNGTMKPKITTVKILADVLEVNFSWLCGADTEKYSKKRGDIDEQINDLLKDISEEEKDKVLEYVKFIISHKEGRN